MCDALLVIQDRDLSETLSVVLEEAGYSIAICADTAVALTMLRVAEKPLVVMLSHGGTSRKGSTFSQPYLNCRHMPMCC
jgi:DNA-binding response OmpR family regulator